MNPSYSYISADLSTAYNNMDWPRSVGDTTNRKLDYFYRNFVYLRPANLFVVYDRVKAFASSNANGVYIKRLRWHVPTQPLVSGSSIRVDNSDARLWLQTLLPANPTITTSSLVSNPDNTWGAWLNYLFASKSYRAEVSNAANPLQQPFLTVMQAGTTSLSEPTSALFYTRLADDWDHHRSGQRERVRGAVQQSHGASSPSHHVDQLLSAKLHQRNAHRVRA